MSSRLVLIALTSLTIVLAACGDDEGDTTVGTPLSKTDFVAQANAICADAEADIDAAAEERFGDATEQPSDEELNAFATEVAIPRTEQQIEAIDALGAPEGDDDQIDEILDAARSGLDAVRDDAAAAFTSGDDPFAEANDLSEAYGLDECAN